MSFWCKLLGHRWEGCTCRRCGAGRDKKHRFEPVEGQCQRQCALCGKVETLPCDWHHCACKRCGALRDAHHDWMYTSECEQVCRVCGREREHHRWQPVDRGIDRCRHCGKVHRLTQLEIAKRDEEWGNGFE